MPPSRSLPWAKPGLTVTYRSPLTAHWSPLTAYLSLLPPTLLHRDLPLHPQREVGQAVELVLAGRGAREADLVHRVRLGEERGFERSHLVGHVLLENVRRAGGDAVGPERDVVRTTGLVV